MKVKYSKYMRFIAIARMVFCVMSWVMLLSKKGDFV